jgi:predicted dehydrogenase
MIGIGVLGCGVVSRLHASAAQRLVGAGLTAVADIQRERAEELAHEFGVKPYSNLEELLAARDVDLVCICTPSGTHGQLGAATARAGRHVVVEKPIDVSRAAADELITAAASAGVLLSVISQHRFDPGIVTVREALLSGEMGPITLADARAWWYRAQSYYDSGAWRGTRALDGGALMNQGVHLVDLLLHLLGPVTSVFARSATVAHRMEAEDLLTANLLFKRGTQGVLTVTTASYPGDPEGLALVGPNECVTVKAGLVESWKSAKAVPAYQLAASGLGSAATGSRGLAINSHLLQLQDVVDALREGRPPAVTGLDGKAALEVVLAAYTSCQQRRDVDVLKPG